METPETFDEYMTPAEVARLLGVAPRTVSRWADQGRISHSVTLGGHRRFLRSDIVKLLDLSRRSQSAAAR
jgi:excisionase family DNA binding protein